MAIPRGPNVANSKAFVDSAKHIEFLLGFFHCWFKIQLSLGLFFRLYHSSYFQNFAAVVFFSLFLWFCVLYKVLFWCLSVVLRGNKINGNESEGFPCLLKSFVKITTIKKYMNFRWKQLITLRKCGYLPSPCLGFHIHLSRDNDSSYLIIFSSPSPVHLHTLMHTHI